MPVVLAECNSKTCSYVSFKSSVVILCLVWYITCSAPEALSLSVSIVSEMGAYICAVHKSKTV